MRIKSDDDSIFDFTPVEFLPLPYEDLERAAVGNEKDFKFKIEAVEITRQKDSIITDLPDQLLPVTIDSKHPLPFYALVPNGWLPVSLVEPNYLLIDQNVVITIEKLLAGKTHLGMAEADWWLNFIIQSNLTLNPLLYAFEGKKRLAGSEADFKSDFAEASATLQEKFADAKIISFSDAQIKMVYAEMNKIAAHRVNDSAFLKQVAPLIAKDVSKPKLAAVQEEIFKIARATGVSKNSFALFAALSAIFYQPQSGHGRLQFNPAKKILKPCDSYSDEMVYNALSDLQSLEIYAGSLALSASFDLPPFALVTADKAVALFGCGLDIHNLKLDAGGVSFQITLTEHLFRRLDDHLRAELLRLHATL